MGYLDNNGVEKLLENLNVKFEELKGMIGNSVLDIPNQYLPYYDESIGRYTNESIVRWINLFADSKVYGVKVYKFEFDSSSEACEKTGANEGLVLEPSFNDSVGRNDYAGRKLFWCHRVNGGCDSDGMPYVTAIEGLDDRFDPTTQNTFALTPIYYYKYTEYDEYFLREYCDTMIDGFKVCIGAYSYKSEKVRPYILRACYQTTDIDGELFNSKSGYTPLQKSSTDNISMSQTNITSISWNRVEEDSLSFLVSWDITYRNEFMQLMLGAKSFKYNAPGNCRTYDSYKLYTSLNSKNIRVTRIDDYTLSHIPIGSYITISSGDYTPSSPNFGDIGLRLPIVSIFQSPNYTTIQVAKVIQTKDSYYAMLGECPTGLTDYVKGTYGFPTYDLEGVYSSPFRFQNVEWGNGPNEVSCNTTISYISSKCILSIDDYITSRDIELDRSFWTMGNPYIKDMRIENGMMIPYSNSSTGASASSGYMCTVYTPYNSNPSSISGTHAVSFDGLDMNYYPKYSDSYCGTGFIDAKRTTTSVYPYSTTRISTTLDTDITY